MRYYSVGGNNMELEKEFQFIKAFTVFKKTVEKLSQYNEDTQGVDIPEFCKMYEDRITTQADRYVTRVINEGRLNEVFMEITK
jgi:hypothetical protein